MTSATFEFLEKKLNINILGLAADTGVGSKKYWHGCRTDNGYSHGKFGAVLEEVKNFQSFRCRRDNEKCWWTHNEKMVTYDHTAPIYCNFRRSAGLRDIGRTSDWAAEYIQIVGKKHRCLKKPGRDEIYYPEIYACGRKCIYHYPRVSWTRVAGGWTTSDTIDAQIALAKIKMLAGHDDEKVDITLIPIIRYSVLDKTEAITIDEIIKRLRRYNLIPRESRRRSKKPRTTLDMINAAIPEHK